MIDQNTTPHKASFSKRPSLAKGLLRLYLDEKNTVSPALIKDIGSS